jgi:hypothetical protein
LSIRPPRLQYGMGFTARRRPSGLVISSDLRREDERKRFLLG